MALDESRATDAYEAFVEARFLAARNPSATNHRARIQRSAIDPALGQALDDLTTYQVNHLVWRGTPPSSRARVLSVDDSAKPFATVTIIDCPTVSASWRPYDQRTGKPLALVKPKTAPPWATTATVIRYHGRWVVRSYRTNTSRTCEP